MNLVQETNNLKKINSMQFIKIIIVGIKGPNMIVGL